MHVLFVHQNYPAQFGHIASRLVRRHGFRCTFVTESPAVKKSGLEYVHYGQRGGATARNHRLSRSFENFTWKSHAVYEALKARPDIQPDLVVGHSGFGSTLFLGDLYRCPVINHCEWYYRGSDSDGSFLGHADPERGIRNRAWNAGLLADLEACCLGYSPTWWQRSRIPTEFQYKLATIFDGIDTEVWRPALPGLENRRIGKCVIPEGVRVVTYVSRGFESIRGFDVFVDIARRIADRRSDTVFLCIGSDRVCYGSDLTRIAERSYREHVLGRMRVPEERFLFAGPVTPTELARAFGFSDLHIYLTAPFVLSWSLMDALACGCPVLVSDTQPLREVIEHGRNGLMSPYYDVDRFVELALQVLADPAEHKRTLGEAGRGLIEGQYSLDVVLPKMLDLYERAISGRPPTPLPETRPQVPATASAGGDGLSRLRCENDWPTMQGTAEANRAPSSVGPSDRAVIADALPNKAELILELGAWEGHRTRLLAEMSPMATVLAVERWHGCRESASHPDWIPRLPQIWERFARNCADLHDRIVPMRCAPTDGLQEVFDAGLEPDCVFIDCDYDLAEVQSVLATARRLFPRAVLIGDDWRWWAVRDTVRDLSAAPALHVYSSANTWVARPAPAGRPSRDVAIWAPGKANTPIRAAALAGQLEKGQTFRVERLRAVPLSLPLSFSDATALGIRGLHCGSGGTLLPGCLNTDAAALVDQSGLGTERDRIYLCDDATLYLPHDATQLFPLADHVFDWVYSEHFIEHLTPDAASAWLAEVRRVLKPGGLLRISTPDLAKYAAGYTDPQGKFYQIHQRRLHEMGVRGASQRKAWMLNQIFRLWQHQWIYDFAELEQAVVSAGFPRAAVQRCGFQQGGLEEVARLDQAVRNDESLYLEVRKPEQVVRPATRKRRDHDSHRPRILVAIPHYHAESNSRLFGSLKESRQARGRALAKCVASLHANFGGLQWMSSLAKPERFPANGATGAQLSVLVCTTRGRHALADCQVPPKAFEHVDAACPGPLLGYACHAELKRRLGQFDYYCYVEDDLLVRDPWWFQKLAWFSSQMGEECLLQPNRYELSRDGSGVKVYIDGDLPDAATERYQDVSIDRQRIASYLGTDIMFRRALNPHAGCFFLTAAQLEEWSKRSYFLDRDRSFYSPLESAASVGIMRTFRVYKPALEAANFLEVQHCGDAWMRKIGRRDLAAERTAERQIPQRPEEVRVQFPANEVQIVQQTTGSGIAAEPSTTPELLRFPAEVVTGSDFQ